MDAVIAAGEQALHDAAAMGGIGMSESERNNLYSAIRGPLFIQSPIQVCKHSARMLLECNVHARAHSLVSGYFPK